MKKPVLKLTGREQRICEELIRAAEDAAALCSIKMQTEPDLAVPASLRENTGRRLKPYFDLYHLVMTEHLTAVARILGTEDPEAFIRAYRRTLQERSEGPFPSEQTESLRCRVKVFLKDASSANRIRSRKLYIADQHFYHGQLCARMDRRGFADAAEMNAHMIAQWNNKVTPEDEVYILGDFSIAGGEATNKILQELQGKLYLISGNHDLYLKDRRFKNCFQWVQPYAEIHDNGRKVILSHYPVFCYNGQYRLDRNGSPAAYMLYGHVHNTHDEQLVHRFIMQTRKTRVMSRDAVEPQPIPCSMINCFCMFSGYQPMTLDEWIRIDARRRAALTETLKTAEGSEMSFVTEPTELTE